MLGVADNGQIFIEEYYDDSYIAQYCLTEHGEIIASVNEADAQNNFSPIQLPSDLLLPSHPLNHRLNYTGLRLRGLREAEKVGEWVQPLPIMEKMPLLQALEVTTSPMMIFGIAESRVLAETKLTEIQFMVCRRVRLLRALPEIHYDDNQLPYDYDTITFHVLHTYDSETENYPQLHVALKQFPELHLPTDCLFHNDKLIVTCASFGDIPCEVHIFQLTENDSE